MLEAGENCVAHLQVMVLVHFRTKCSFGPSLMRQMCQEFWASFYQFKKSSCQWSQKLLMFLCSCLSHQRPSPAPWCLTASTWSCRPPSITAPTSCWRPRFGPQGATLWVRAGLTVTRGRAAGRVWPVGPSASWPAWCRARTVETATEIGDATGRWVAIGGARSSGKSPVPAMTSAHCDAHADPWSHIYTHTYPRWMDTGVKRKDAR